MSEYIEFFTAPSDAAAKAVRVRGPGSPVSGSFFDAEDAVITWENVLTGSARPNMATLTEPRIVAEYHNDGSGVFELPPALVSGLALADPPRLWQIAEAWSEHEARNGNEIGTGTAYRLLDGVAGLARESIRAGHRVYCWVSC